MEASFLIDANNLFLSKLSSTTDTDLISLLATWGLRATGCMLLLTMLKQTGCLK
jgi:hypothetical protein